MTFIYEYDQTKKNQIQETEEAATIEFIPTELKDPSQTCYTQHSTFTYTNTEQLQCTRYHQYQMVKEKNDPWSS